jgi:hypothetical protein
VTISEVMARHFELRSPFPDEALPGLWKMMEEFKPQMLDDWCPQTFEAMRAMYHDGRQRLSYAIYVNGEAIGWVWGDLLGDSVYLGHLTFARYLETLPSSEKLRMARAALRQMFRDGARKIQWHLFRDNRAFHVFLKRLGAEQEGLLRQSTRRGGELMDVIVMASFPEGSA